MSCPPVFVGPPPAPTLGQALRFWWRLGWISFGGPAGQIALMHAELVERRRWISEARFLHALNYCMLLPGPEAQQLATYIGWLLHGKRGGIAAGALFVLPSLGILIGLSWVAMRFGQWPVVAGLLFGIKPAVVAIVLQAAQRLGRRVLHHAFLWGIAVAAFIALAVLKLPYPAIVLGAAALGALGARVVPQAFQPGDAGRPAPSMPAGSAGPAFIDDRTPLAPHAHASLGGALRVLAAGAALWAGALALLAASTGAAGLLTRMAWFFTRAALLTFGGAYAVLPYVAQAAVEQQHWLNAAEMIDGLALGESTPGPLIMVVAYVGFVAGWLHPMFGAEARALAGIAGACVVSFFSFLPSFVFVLAGAPSAEATQGRLGYTAPLAAVSAAVVGVILQLALYFAGHVLWPQGVNGPVDFASACIASGAWLALWRGRLGVLPVLGLCALAGLALRLGAPGLIALEA